ncbi:MAG: PfkB family carbohydrate kinase, partial [Deltaproteobacteria bacterium]
MIVAYGDAIVDLFAWPRGSDVASATHFVPRQGGAPANVAVVAARLGAPVRFVGAVGRDGHGE